MRTVMAAQHNLCQHTERVTQGREQQRYRKSHQIDVLNN